MQKRPIIFLLFILLSGMMAAQNGVMVGMEHTVSNKWTFSLGNIKLADSYLSNQEYSGLAYGLKGQHGAYYHNTTQVSWHFFEKIKAGQLINASYSAAILYGSANIGFGSHYIFKDIFKGFSIKTGAIIDAYAGIKYQNRNVNNPVSSDIQLQLLASLAAEYCYVWKNFGLHFGYSLSAPILGGMFIPQMGQSYYEIYLDNYSNLNKVVHFSSFHNMYGINGLLSCNLIFKGFTLNLSFNHNTRKWNGNNLNFYTKELAGEIGTTIDIVYRNGRKSQPQKSVLF